MLTRMLPIDAHSPDDEALHTAADVLQKGGLVAFPTETVYGLGADALDEAAVERIFVAKGRPADNPLIVHVASIADVDELASLNDGMRRRFEKLAQRYWPGPLTIIVPKSAHVPDIVTAGLPSVAVRMPDHPVALGLIRAAGRPVAAPSANRSGRPSPTDASHVWHDLAGRIDLVLDGGSANIGVESTVLDLSVEPPIVHRPGAVTVDELASTLQVPVYGGGVSEPDAGGQDAGAQRANDAPRSPGVKYEHYAPVTPCVLVEGKAERIEEALLEAISEAKAAGERIAVLSTEETAHAYRRAADVVCVAGSRNDHRTIAYNVYRCLRQLDQCEADIIFIEGIAPEGLGEAIMNRLRRAAGYRIMHAH